MCADRRSREGQTRTQACRTGQSASEFLLEDYHRRKHSETDATPLERWEEAGFLPRMPESLEQLDLLLLTVPKTRVIHQDGIRFQGLRFVDPILAAYVGESGGTAL